MHRSLTILVILTCLLGQLVLAAVPAGTGLCVRPAMRMLLPSTTPGVVEDGCCDGCCDNAAGSPESPADRESIVDELPCRRAECTLCLRAPSALTTGGKDTVRSAPAGWHALPDATMGFAGFAERGRPALRWQGSQRAIPPPLVSLVGIVILQV